jgi:hypothetical protein
MLLLVSMIVLYITIVTNFVCVYHKRFCINISTEDEMYVIIYNKFWY